MDSSSSLNDDADYSWSGAWGSGAWHKVFNLGPRQRDVIRNGGDTVTLTDSTQTVSFSTSVSHYHGTTGSTVQVTIPARYARTPTAFTATRVSDSQINLAWTKNSSYSAVVVQRRTDEGEWIQIARPTGNVAAYTDTTTVAGHRYDYRVAGYGGSGQSAFTAPVSVFTSPSAPTGVSAARDGSDIVVAAGTVPAYVDEFDVRDGSTVYSGVSLPFRDVSPNPSIPHTYEARGVVDGLAGAWSAPSNTVQLISAPNAPTGLTPNGGVAASDVDVRFSWVHNPVDSSPQTVYGLRHRPVGGAWTTLSGTTASFRDVTLSEGDFEWQARTKGAHASFSPWSSVATVTVITRPGVAVTQPDSDWDLTELTVEWSYVQAQSRPQSSWRVTLFNGDLEQLEQRTGAGAQTSVAMSRRIVNGNTYTVQVEAATGIVWSAVASQTFTAAFLPPAVPVLDAVWDEGSGSVTVVTDAGSSDDEDTPDTISMELERSVDGGESWELIFNGFDPAQTVIDFESLSYGDTMYRATAYTAAGAAAETVVTVEARSGAVWLAGGPGFALCGRLPFNPKVSVTVGRSRAARQYAGRSLPVAYAGEAVGRSFSVSGMTADEALQGEVTAAVSLLDDISTAVEPTHMLRDPDGRRVYGLIGDVQVSRDTAIGGTVRPWNGLWGYSFTLTDTGGAQ